MTRHEWSMLHFGEMNQHNLIQRKKGLGMADQIDLYMCWKLELR